MKYLSAIFLLALLAAGCATDRNKEISGMLDRKEIKVGVEANFKPLVFKEDNQIKGIEYDFASKIGSITGAKISIVEIAWDELIPALEAGRIDVIMSGMTITEERSKKVNFTAPYIKAGQMALMKTEDTEKYSSPVKIMNTDKKIGFIKGTTGDFFVTSKCPNAEKIPFIETTDGIKSLADGEIDVFIIDAPVVWEMSNTRLTPLLEPLTEEYLGWAVRKNDTVLLDVLNKCLEQMRKDGSLGEIEANWVPKILLR